MENINNISPDKQEFLQRTTVIAKPPKSLWYIGKLPKLAPTVAIVGSRKPTVYGREITLQLSRELAERGVIIVSGLAIGHDALAAQGALEGGGITVGVVGNGLANQYPRTTWALREKIIANGGAVISEYPPDFPVYKGNFLWRNRLISALSDVVVVVEAGERSGTLNTAGHAIEQGKELMAVPGNITSPLSIGCNRLIAQGATPVLSVDDIFERLGMNITQTSLISAGNTPAEKLVYKLIRLGISDGDELISRSDLAVSDVSMALTMLEITGSIRPLGANRWAAK